MPVKSYEVYDRSPQRHCVRIRIRCTLDDGRQIEIGPIPVCPKSKEEDVIATRCKLLEERMVTRDSLIAVSEGKAIEVQGEASELDVARAYVKEAMKCADPVCAFKMLDKAHTFFAAKGYTSEQARVKLGFGSEKWDLMSQRYQKLKAKSAEIQAFEAVLEGDKI